jgi:type I restriction-modification system DNA methylase subunit
MRFLALVAATAEHPEFDRSTAARLEPAFSPEGQLIDFLTDDLLVDRPEERVRQRYLRILHHQYGYPKDVFAREVPIYHGRSQARDEAGNPIFADIVVYENANARAERDQGQIRFVVENKAPDQTTGHNQLVSYIFNTSANGAVWYNGDGSAWFRRYSVPEQRLVPWPGIPRHREAWDAVGRQTKRDLRSLVDVRGTLARCNNKLHRRGSEGDDLTMDMVRLLLAKARDEEREGEEVLFYCTPEEYLADDGRRAVAERIQGLFTEVREANPTVFENSERIQVGDLAIAEVVVELQDYRLIGDDDIQWDIMGAAYEQYTAEILKREGGEFFTNRLVVRLLTKMVNPSPDHLVLDPAGGTGGFCTATIRHMRDRIRHADATDAVKQRRMEQIKDRIFYIDVKHRLVKIAKAAMILTGNGHRGFTQGDSLGPINQLPEGFRAKCQPATIDRVLTNPPFAGTTNGKIDAPHEMVPQFQLARRWEWRDGDYVATDEPLPGGTPPEVLFVERCLQWLKPGGLMGVVVPKGVIENPEVSLALRHFIVRHAFVRAVIACHKNTFQPYTGSRTALLVLQKKTAEEAKREDPDYPIFMAISRKIGQDSEGVPIYIRDEEGRPTEALDHDLDEIFASWQEAQEDSLEPSEYTFTVPRSNLDPRSLILSPQSFQPSLNEAIAEVIRLGETDDFVVTPLGELASRIFKGARFKREDLETDEANGGSIVRYYTPGALLQDRPESIKYLDLSRAPTRRRKEIEKHELERLELLVTRSGSIGRVLLTTTEHAGHIGSDDLIRINIPDDDLKAYVFLFLRSDLGQKQMKKNEYGTIQQHLEPAHLRELLVPVPTDPEVTGDVARRVLDSIRSKEQSIDREREASDLLGAALRRDSGA